MCDPLVAFFSLLVDDQLDEDDLELIKENIGFDIQAVSSEPLPRH